MLSAGLIVDVIMSRKNMKEHCKWVRAFDGHYTPNCVNDHGYRVNGMVNAKSFNVCPYCQRPILVKD